MTTEDDDTIDLGFGRAPTRVERDEQLIIRALRGYAFTSRALANLEGDRGHLHAALAPRRERRGAGRADRSQGTQPGRRVAESLSCACWHEYVRADAIYEETDFRQMEVRKLQRDAAPRD